MKETEYRSTFLLFWDKDQEERYCIPYVYSLYKASANTIAEIQKCLRDKAKEGVLLSGTIVEILDVPLGKLYSVVVDITGKIIEGDYPFYKYED